MREPTPEIMRDVSARLSGQQATDGGAYIYRGADGPDSKHPGGEAYGQHFDIFSREQTLRPASWVICWSDLMMTMFIMFAALYLFQIPKIQFKSVSETSVSALPLGTEVIPSRPSDGSILDRLHDRLRDLVVRDGLQAAISVQSVPGKALHVTISGDLLFQGSSLALRGMSKKPSLPWVKFCAAPRTLCPWSAILLRMWLCPGSGGHGSSQRPWPPRWPLF